MWQARRLLPMPAGVGWGGAALCTLAACHLPLPTSIPHPPSLPQQQVAHQRGGGSAHRC